MARVRSAPSKIMTPGVRFTVVPEPTTIRHDIINLGRLIQDYEQPLRWSKQTIVDDVKNAFETETDPINGIPWPMLSQRARQVERFGKLQRKKTNRKLYRAMVQPMNYGVSKGGVFINQRRIPFYAAFHQQDDLGQLREPSKEELVVEQKRLFAARALHHLARSDKHLVELLRSKAQENVRENIKVAAEEKGHTRIPRRRFLGPSKYAVTLMERNFDRWARDVIIIYKRGGRFVVSSRAGAL